MKFARFEKRTEEYLVAHEDGKSKSPCNDSSHFGRSLRKNSSDRIGWGELPGAVIRLGDDSDSAVYCVL
ncbi:hypothetical protein CEXT_261311 [Caerostris extrusa]|uniref:Uncharacterized protein n=1 Tax=Caerostris extrusa TaxID=172846 RepID=A0AAV4U0G8_CAEEX|nr:hypothetical protein CEXT_261311 [Caerostris extrusa]